MKAIDAEQTPEQPPRPDDRDQHKIPRRGFLLSSATLTAGLLAAGTISAWGEGRAAGPVERRPRRSIREVIMIDRVSVSKFQEHVGESFPARSADGRVYDLILIEAKALEPQLGLSHLGVREDPFSLLFRAPVDVNPGQGVYAIDHPEFATFDLFMVPVGFHKPSEPTILQAVVG